ncbi:hypothetical protein [uncultured Vagococcus sp.]|uniref:hypothetical protein n=1 Tax=uncultured Vagococcus sp. TaxID=189676 RepID=UPI0028D37B65|nr:hypothetical protein [uncultured Vagococcus sp.]
MTVNVKRLLSDAQLQVSEFKGGRLKTAALYIQLLKDVKKSSVEPDVLLAMASNVQTDPDTKADLLKMVMVNYSHFKNKVQVDSLMKKYNLDSSELKPLTTIL